MEADLKSEGQAIVYSFIYNFVISKEYKEADVILIDEIDSGLSSDNITCICNILLETARGKQVIIACNNYHFAYLRKKMLNISTGKEEEVKDYKTFSDKMLIIRDDYEYRKENKRGNFIEK